MTGWIKRFKSPWYYGHTGHSRIAVISLGVSTLVLWRVFGATVGFSMVGILDTVVFSIIESEWPVVKRALHFEIERRRSPPSALNTER